LLSEHFQIRALTFINLGLHEKALSDLRQALKLLQESDNKATDKKTSAKQIRRARADITQVEEVLAGKGLYWCQI